MLLPMPHEAATIAVSLGTNGTLVGTNALVEIHVVIEHFRSDERSVAGGALKRIFRFGKRALVYPFVSVEEGEEGELV